MSSLVEEVEPFVHLFLTKKYAYIINHPYYTNVTQSEEKVKKSYMRMCLLGLIMCQIKHDLMDKCKYILNQYSFQDYFPERTEQMHILRKCIQYKKMEIAKEILQSSNIILTYTDVVDLGYDGYILYILSEKRMFYSQSSLYLHPTDINHPTNTEEKTLSGFEIDMGCFSIFRQIEDQLSRTFLLDSMKHKMDPKTYLSHILRTRGLIGIQQYLESEIPESCVQEINIYVRGNQPLDIIQEEDTVLYDEL